MSNTRSNILWLSLESVRADHTSLYDYERDTTPFLRQLSSRQNATTLNSMVAASNWTPASTASMLTGTHMSTHQVGQDGTGTHSLPTEINTLPELLFNEGYQTALFSPNPYISDETELTRGFEHHEMLTIRNKENFIGLDSLTRDNLKIAFRRFIENPTVSFDAFKHDLGNSTNCLVEYRFRRWLNEQYRQKDPSFVYAHIQSPHFAYHPISKFRDYYTSEIDMSTAEADSLSDEVYEGEESITKRIASGLDLSDKEWEGIRAMYDADIRYADYTVERLVRMAENTMEGPLIIIIVGDHGDLFGEYGLIGHTLSLHDGLIRVPGLIVGFDNINQEDNDIIQHIDLTRTLANLTGVSTDQFEGRDIRNSSRTYAISQLGSTSLERYTKCNQNFDETKFFGKPYTSVRTSEWKLLTNEEKTLLYELPDEKNNVSFKYPDIVERISKAIDKEGIIWNDLKGDVVDRDEEMKEQLKNLGYIT